MNPKVKWLLLFFAIVLLAGLAITFIDGAEARTAIWDGGDAGALASTAANWDLDTAPIAGDDILFDGVNDDACTWNLVTNSFGTFTIAAGYSGTITQSSDLYITGYSQAGGTFTGGAATGKILTLNGNWAFTAGTFTPYATYLKMIKENSTMSAGNIGYFNPLQISANNVRIGSGNYMASLVVDSGKTCNIGTIASNYIYILLGYNTNYYLNNLGSINGPGQVVLYFNTIDRNDVSVGYVERLLIRSVGSNPRIMTLQDSVIGELGIDGNTNSMRVDLNGHSLTASSITVGTRGILQCGEGTITTTSLDSSAGAITEEIAKWIFTGTGNLKIAAGQKLYEITFNGTTTLQSNVNVDIENKYTNIDGRNEGIYTYTPGYIRLHILNMFLNDMNGLIPDVCIFYNLNNTLLYTVIINDENYYLVYSEFDGTLSINNTQEIDSIRIIVGDATIYESLSVDIILGLLLWLVITGFMIFGFVKEIPLVMLFAFAGEMLCIIATLQIPDFSIFTFIFAMCNAIIFFIGMVRWRR